MTKPQLVVAAAIVNDLSHPTYLLCAARSYPPELSGKWELPGGKIELGEDPYCALKREIREELSQEIILGKEITAPNNHSWPLPNSMTMRVWLAELANSHEFDATIAPPPGNSHTRLCWVRFNEVADLDWLPADIPIISATYSHVRTNHSEY